MKPLDLVPIASVNFHPGLEGRSAIEPIDIALTQPSVKYWSRAPVVVVVPNESRIVFWIRRHD
jgi:hypothetical protein